MSSRGSRAPATVLGDASVLEDAVRAADFVLERMRRCDGRLLRVYDDGRAHVDGLPRRPRRDARRPASTSSAPARASASSTRPLAARRRDPRALLRPADGDLYLTPPTASTRSSVIHRPRSEHDGATPDAAGLALLGLARLAALAESQPSSRLSSALALAESAPLLERAPHAFPTLLRAVAAAAAGASPSRS